MLTKYEMSRSLYLTGIIIMIEQLFIVSEIGLCYLFLRIFILSVLTIVFMKKKERFGMYRIQILLRTTYLILSKKEK